MNKGLKLIHLIKIAAEQGTHIVADETSVLRITAAGITVYTTARHAKHGAGI